MKLTWTKPYYGVKHLEGLTPHRVQITYSEWTHGSGRGTVYLLTREEDTNYTKVAEANGKHSSCMSAVRKWKKRGLFKMAA